jgi:hypothetical protein
MKVTVLFVTCVAYLLCVDLIQVAAKTQKFGMPQRIAVMEVIIDELLQRRDSKEKVLLHIIREYEPEYKVPIFFVSILFC